MKKSEAINELAASLAKAQGEIRGAIKDSDNPFFKSRYADLASVWEACRLPLTKNGLSVVQTLEETEKGTSLDTLLLHVSGQWISSSLILTPIDRKPQSMGSAITYARRYALQAMVGIAPEDDDGNAASGVTIPQMRMEQPSSMDGNFNEYLYRFNFGQYKGKTVEQVYGENHPKCGPDGLKSYVRFLDEQEAKGKLTPAAAEARKHIEDFLGVVENTPV